MKKEDPEGPPIKPPNEAAGCIPCRGCIGFRLPLSRCSFCGYYPTKTKRIIRWFFKLFGIQFGLESAYEALPIRHRRLPLEEQEKKP